jgi:hypothetical protein
MNHAENNPSPLSRLIQSYPRLFKGEPPAVHSHLPAGWYARVDKLCADIDSLLDDEHAKRFSVAQVKSKFGSLRFYYRFEQAERDVIITDLSGGNRRECGRERRPTKVAERLRELVNAACNASDNLCEECGAPGSMRMFVDDEKLAPLGYITEGVDWLERMPVMGLVSAKCDAHARAAALRFMRGRRRA